MRTFRLIAILFAATSFVPPTHVADADELTPVGGALPYAAKIREIVDRGITAGQLPGAVVVIAGPDSVQYAQAFGLRRLEPAAQEMTLDTVFDLASLTKPIATATSVMKLVEQGKVDVERPVVDYLPEFKGHGKEQIRVEQLLLHVGGLIPDNALRDYQDGPEKAWQRICDLKLVAAPGEAFKYTDVGFVVLGKLVERLSGKSLDRFADEATFAPLGMKETTFNPPARLRDRAAPTEKREGQWMTGEVHDPRAFLLGGVAGHAGLFSTATDLVAYAQMMLAGGSRGETSVYHRETIRMMTTPRNVPRGSRTYGWDHRTGYSRNRGETLSDAAFGHGGFTGTVLWIDPEKETIFLFLSNRLHPDGEGSVNGLAGEIATLIGVQ